ncbi:nuclease-related domain-containing protein [Bacillus piscicola]|uniref:nuclease-related domain-containing protein n=1 Tax=Bacillus piscicola TaxID=1632684 RepID=UPI001F09C262|nr:nuclease-related domain-containing protein [Bacillus piscicola]
MFLKTRTKPKELQIFHYVDARMTLPKENRQHFRNIEKGFEGEKMFDHWLRALSVDCLVLNDLTFNVQQSYVQLDSLVLLRDTLFLFEVKNFEGDFYLEDDRWYAMSGTEISHPLHQVKRAESLLSKLLRHNRSSLSIAPYLIFINPEFMLYHALPDPSIIFPNQLKQFFTKFNSRASSITQQHQQLAERLLSLHTDKSPYQKFPKYEYKQLKKGVTCDQCGSFLLLVDERFHCRICKNTIDRKTAVLQQTAEFAALFPEKKITTAAIFEWCAGVIPMRQIRYVLKRNYTLIGRGRYAYFVENPMVPSPRNPF